MALFRSASGVPVSYHATWTEWRGYKFYVDVYGDRGMVRGYYAPMFNLLVTQPEPGGRRTTTRRFYPEIILREKLRSWETTALRSFEDEWEEFLTMLRGEPSRNADGVAGLRAVEIAHAVRESTDTGEAVHLPPPPPLKHNGFEAPSKRDCKHTVDLKQHWTYASNPSRLCARFALEGFLKPLEAS